MTREGSNHVGGEDMTRQRHQMGEGGRGMGAQSFGIDGSALMGRDIPGMPIGAEMLSDKERACGPCFPRGGGEMHGQRMPDHGPHRHPKA